MLINEKVIQAVNLLKEFKFDCWLTFARESALNGDPMLAFLAPADITWHSAFIITAGGRREAVVGKYDVAAIEETGAYDRVTGFVTGFREPFLRVMKELDPKTIAVNYSEGSEICDGLTHGMYLTLVGFLDEIGMARRLVSAERITSALRERKSAFEIAAMREAVRKTEEIFGKVSLFIKPGMTESEIAAFMRVELERQGLKPAWAPAMCPSVFTGPDTAEAHYGPTGRVVEQGHVLNMDFGVRTSGYCSDMQRSFYILRDGETEAPEPVRKGFDTIVRALESARKTMKPGAQGIEVDTAARTVITGAGYEEFPHALGHQVGRFAHDGTALLGPAWEKYGSKPLRPLEENMVFAVEPRLTVPGHGVATVEDMAIITCSGAEWLSNTQRELILIR